MVKEGADKAEAEDIKLNLRLKALKLLLNNFIKIIRTNGKPVGVFLSEK